MIKDPQEEEGRRLHFYGGYAGILAPLLLFILGVVFIALMGSPDEKGFWPVLLLALALGLILSRDREYYSQTVIEGMAQPIVMVMIAAWILASIIGVLMTNSGFVEGLIWLISVVKLGGPAYVVACFIVCCIVSLSTGSSFATILICGPLLYPAGGLAGAPLSILAGAIIGGATFGDFTAPISDTTIASALSQKAQIGGVVRSRIKYIVPAALMALLAYYLVATNMEKPGVSAVHDMNVSPGGLLMSVVPAYIILLFLKGRHLVHGLLMGLIVGLIVGLSTGLLPLSELFAFDPENFSVRSIVIDGIQRAVGISIFTILLMGLVQTVKKSGLIDDVLGHWAKKTVGVRQSEWMITAMTGTAVLLTTHSIVAILATADFANEIGQRRGLSRIRRANLMGMVVCVFPFLLPYFIPVILMANMTRTGLEMGLPAVSVWQAGIFNFVSWGLLIVLVWSLISGYGRRRDSRIDMEKKIHER